MGNYEKTERIVVVCPIFISIARFIDHDPDSFEIIEKRLFPGQLPAISQLKSIYT
jgi:hypothetical protein